MTSPKTLIHILTANRWGGVERYALDICKHFIDSGWNVMAITRDAKVVDTPFEKAGVNLLHAPFGGMLDFQSIRFLTKVLKKNEGEVIIHVHGFKNAFTALAARRLSGKKSTKIILTRHKVKPALDSRLMRRIYRNLDAMIFVSRVARDRFMSTWYARELPFDFRKIHIIHNSINTPVIEPIPPHDKGPITAMFHGPILPGKGLETLIDALSMVKGKRIRLRIVGGGNPDYADKLRRHAINRGVMDLIDWHRHSETPMELIKEVDFGVLPSHAEEAFGLANIEYMACGRPQICSSNGAQPEYITDGKEGILIPPAGTPFLAEAMMKLAADESLRKEMGEKAFQKFSTTLSWPHFISRLTSIYSA